MSRATGTQVVADGLAVPGRPPARRPDRRADPMLGSPGPRRSATASPTPRWPPGSTAASTTTCSPAWATAWPRACAVGLGEHGHRLGLPARLLGAGAGRVPRPRQPSSACSPSAKSSSGATGSRRGTSASATSAATCPARAGRTRSPTAPTRSACWPRSPHFAAPELTVLLDVLADRLLLPVDRAVHHRRARPDGAGHDAGAAPQRRAARRCSSPGWPGSRPRPRDRRAPEPTATPSSTTGNAAGLPAGALPPARPGRRPAGRCAPTCCWSWSTRCAATNPHYLRPR